MTDGRQECVVHRSPTKAAVRLSCSRQWLWGPCGLAQVTVTCESLPLKLSWTLSTPPSGQLRGLDATGSDGCRISLLFIPRTKKGDTNQKDEKHCAAKGAVCGPPDSLRGSRHRRATPARGVCACPSTSDPPPPSRRSTRMSLAGLRFWKKCSHWTPGRLAAPISRVGVRVSYLQYSGGCHASDRSER